MAELSPGRFSYGGAITRYDVGLLHTTKVGEKLIQRGAQAAMDQGVGKGGTQKLWMRLIGLATTTTQLWR